MIPFIKAIKGEYIQGGYYFYVGTIYSLGKKFTYT